MLHLYMTFRDISALITEVRRVRRWPLAAVKITETVGDMIYILINNSDWCYYIFRTSMGEDVKEAMK